ncbi:nucleotidyltransferase domain-containing protein [Natronosalvus rutilus]|uniref:Nucleotidyltransferase domain-containing protein n=1 Tax=Natronosalvus rutilus TaxID=2953753 RepID=A0A9E7NBC1_9EURY|nr:nucleotidyltransferase domain-containing protein [Natronosalvus rutilus]UTF54765.1 nucleotidyltransferase domain-containing protein [Natronosalvus rutilus]
MRHDSSTTDTADNPTKWSSVGLPLPIRDTNLFKHSASSHILQFLADNPDIDVSIRQLARVTPTSERATREAVNTLEANGLIETTHEGNARRVRINKTRLDKPTDPIRTIPQSAFQTPVRIARHYITEQLADVNGIILFGSTARGEADRQSDIDLWVLVGEDHMRQRHEANKLVKQLEELYIPSTIGIATPEHADFESNWPAITAQLENESSDDPSAERYSFEIIVETPQSILAQRDRVDTEALFGDGITLLSTETLERVKVEIISDE